MIETFGTGKIADEKIAELVRRNFDLRPYGILKMLDLLNSDRIQYRKTAAYGHFGVKTRDSPGSLRTRRSSCGRMPDFKFKKYLNFELLI